MAQPLPLRGRCAPEQWAADRRPLLPHLDPFCRPPADVAELLPGAVVRARRVEVAMFGRVTQPVSAWQLLYRTTDVHGTPEVAVTTVMLPGDADPAESRPLVSFQCAIDAVASQCFPSYALRRGARAAGSIPQLELPLILAALARGWAVSVPDHEGLDGRFGVAREPGFRALDGIRAATAFTPLGLRSTGPVGLWGYSGGGLATAWAAELAAEYAPELSIVGAVAGSPVGDPASAFLRLNGTVFAGFAAVFTAGLRRAYPALDRLLRTELDDAYQQLLAETETTATLQLLYRFARRDADKHLRDGILAFFAKPEIAAVLADILPGSRAPAMPMLVLQAVHDEVIAVADVDAHVRRYREAGVRLRYLRDRLSKHLSLEFLGTPMMLDWLADRFAGIEPAPEGVETVWSIAALPRAPHGYRDFAMVLLRMVFGRPIRGNDRRGRYGRV